MKFTIIMGILGLVSATIIVYSSWGEPDFRIISIFLGMLIAIIAIITGRFADHIWQLGRDD